MGRACQGLRSDRTSALSSKGGVGIDTGTGERHSLLGRPSR